MWSMWEIKRLILGVCNGKCLILKIIKSTCSYKRQILSINIFLVFRHKISGKIRPIRKPEAINITIYLETNDDLIEMDLMSYMDQMTKQMKEPNKQNASAIVHTRR